MEYLNLFSTKIRNDSSDSIKQVNLKKKLIPFFPYIPLITLANRKRYYSEKTRKVAILNSDISKSQHDSMY